MNKDDWKNVRWGMWAHVTATVCFVGHLKPAPGTWGSLVALPIGLFLYMLGGLWLFLLAIPVAYVKGYYATKIMTEGTDNHDPSEIVIDEVVGQWIALAPVVIGATHAEISPLALWPGIIVAFGLFRLFDITKPGFVGKADNMVGPTGVMLDDVIAGVFAGICVAGLGSFWHGFAG